MGEASAAVTLRRTTEAEESRRKGREIQERNSSMASPVDVQRVLQERPGTAAADIKKKPYQNGAMGSVVLTWLSGGTGVSRESTRRAAGQTGLTQKTLR